MPVFNLTMARLPHHSSLPPSKTLLKVFQGQRFKSIVPFLESNPKGAWSSTRAKIQEDVWEALHEDKSFDSLAKRMELELIELGLRLLFEQCKGTPSMLA